MSRTQPQHQSSRRIPVRSQTPRRDRTGRAEKAHSGSLWLTVLGLAGSLGAICAMLLGLFSVRHVDVVGSGLPVSTIVQAAGVQGQNIFTIRRDEVIRRLQQVPSIEVSRVDTSFPDTVTIYARARVAYVAWRRGTITYLLDDNGNILGTTTAPRLPLIVSLNGAPQPDFPTMQAVRYAASVLPRIPDGKLAPAELDPKQGLVIVGSSGWLAVIGRGPGQAMGTRVATLASLLDHIARNGQALKYADLHLRNGFYCQRGGPPCQSLPAQYGGPTPSPTAEVTATQP